MIKFVLNITFSKIIAVLILILGFIGCIILKNPTLLITSITIAGGLVASKQITDKNTDKKDI